MKSLQLIVLILVFATIVQGGGILEGQTSDHVCGIGAVLANDTAIAKFPASTLISNHLNVMNVFPSGAAEKSGLKKGDEILQVNATLVAGMRFLDAVNMIRGKEGTSVSILIKRSGQSAPLSLTVWRAPVNISTADLSKSEFKDLSSPPPGTQQ